MQRRKPVDLEKRPLPALARKFGTALVSEAAVERPVGLVVCGGGSRGAMEVGFYRATQEVGIPIDLIVGSSIGALNGAYIAAGLSPAELADLWLRFRRRDAIGLNWQGLLHPCRSPGLFSLDRLRKLLQRTLPVTRFEDLVLPLSVATTDLQQGETVYWQGTGDIIEPVVASMSMPGIFPPVELGGRQLVDGGIADNVPLDQAVKLGARHILMIECVCGERCSGPVRGWIDVVMRSFSVAIDGKYQADLTRLDRQARILRVQPRLAHEVNLLDFRHTAELMEEGYRQSLDVLKKAAAESRSAGA